VNRLFAVIPAAGLSRRMGQPKLLLPWQGRTVVEHLLAALAHPRVVARCVVCRRSDTDLARVVKRAGAQVIQPAVDPPEMKDSVLAALDEIEQQWHPTPDEGWVLCPADQPLLPPGILEPLVAAWDSGSADVVIPRHGGRKGHPVLFRWRLLDEIRNLGPDEGLNALVRHPARLVEFVDLDAPGILVDLDTPEDYARWQSEGGVRDRGTA
jgi:molybdenum cofactor cytidylyltransferase